ncbi:MAG: guanylate kinase [Planctomycetes bacterium]|nr:guanylate kinase [Planctomycetota bacterium]
MIDSRTAAGPPPGSTPFRGGLAVLSGPSGSGKTSICNALLEDPRVELSISATTRPARGGEQHGREYWFYSRAEFDRMVAAGDFVEWAQVYANCYGTPRRPLEEASRRTDRLMVLDIDVQGAAQLRKQAIRHVSIFIAPPSIDELKRRLAARRTDSPEVIAERLRWAEQELAQAGTYDHVIVNVDLAATIAAAKAILGL